MTTDIKELVKEARGWQAGHSDDSQRMVWLMNKLSDALEALAGEVAEALPWKLFYKDGLDLEQIGKRLGKSPYEFSPWLYAPLISQLKDREQTALADLAAERDRLAGEVERLKEERDAARDDEELMSKAKQLCEAERDRLVGEVERLTVAAKAADMFHAINGHGIKQAEELADHIIRQMLWGMRIDDSNKGIVRGYLLDHFKAVISRAEAAEAERDRLKAVLERLKRHPSIDAVAFVDEANGGVLVRSASQMIKDALGGDA